MSAPGRDCQALHDSAVEGQRPRGDDFAGAPDQHSVCLAWLAANRDHDLAMARRDAALITAFQDRMGGDDFAVFNDPQFVGRTSRRVTTRISELPQLPEKNGVRKRPEWVITRSRKYRANGSTTRWRGLPQ
jgi:hypothetical protein